MIRTRRSLAAVALTAALAALSGCSSAAPSVPAGSPSTAAATSSGPASGGGTATATATATTVAIKDFKFAPDTLTVAPGTKITVTNQDSTAHTLTATGAKAFDTGTLAPGASATFTAPSAPGDYPYLCTIHQFMTGTLTVKQSPP
ncbi:cupredoxin domain-containing protein [Kitasatospora phosalacinea]|uniref:cupredoxin domain-containing protein n=1 Tax=Kitasatospora phosalacinea TaxID=2065 RepID=UPI00364B5A04